MHTAVMVDASVWASRLMPQDDNHAASRAWIDQYIAAGGHLLAPEFMLVEVSAALTRQTRHPTDVKQTIEDLRHYSDLDILILDSALFREASNVATDLRLKAGDAIYVAIAHQQGVPLVSWDREQLNRAGPLVETYTPDNYPF